MSIDRVTRHWACPRGERSGEMNRDGKISARAREHAGTRPRHPEQSVYVSLWFAGATIVHLTCMDDRGAVVNACNAFQRFLPCSTRLATSAHAVLCRLAARCTINIGPWTDLRRHGPADCAPVNLPCLALWGQHTLSGRRASWRQLSLFLSRSWGFPLQVVAWPLAAC